MAKLSQAEREQLRYIHMHDQYHANEAAKALRNRDRKKLRAHQAAGVQRVRPVSK